jgi:hypothetical protein
VGNCLRPPGGRSAMVVPTATVNCLRSTGYRQVRLPRLTEVAQSPIYVGFDYAQSLESIDPRFFNVLFPDGDSWWVS